MKKLNSIADLKAAAKEYKPILDLRENHTDAIPDKRDILVCGGTGCTSSESLLIIEKLKEEIKKALIYFNIAWSLDSSDTDCEKAINLIMSKNKKAL